MSDVAPVYSHGPGRPRSSDRSNRRSSPGRSQRVVQAHPISTFVAAPYLLLYLPMALIFKNPRYDFILLTGMLAVVGAFFGEVVGNSLQNRRKGVRRGERRAPESLRGQDNAQASYLVGKVALMIGGLSRLIASSQHVGSVVDQLQGAASANSAVGQLTSLFGTWAFTGIALILWAGRHSRVTKGKLRGWTAFFGLVFVVDFISTAISARLISAIIYVTWLLLMFGYIRFRTLITLFLIGMIVIPGLLTVRNDLRQKSDVVIAAQESPYDRLRYDLQITRAVDIEWPLDVGQPQGVDLLRYGLVPRVLDPSRPVLSTGVRIAEHLSGTNTPWAYTFLPVATAYVMEGPYWLLGYYALNGLLAVFLLGGKSTGRNLAVWRILCFALILSGPMAWLATYPDSFIGALQGLVAAVPLLMIRPGRRASGAGSVAPRRRPTYPSGQRHRDGTSAL